MNTPNWLDDDLDLSDEAKRFLADVDEWVYGHRGDMPVPEGSGYVQEIARGLCFRLVLEARGRWGDKLIANYKAGQRLHKARREDRMVDSPKERNHSYTVRAKALALFEKLEAEGNLIKKAEAEVSRLYGVKPRTLRYWRNQLAKSPASF